VQNKIYGTIIRCYCLIEINIYLIFYFSGKRFSSFISFYTQMTGCNGKMVRKYQSTKYWFVITPSITTSARPPNWVNWVKGREEGGALEGRSGFTRHPAYHPNIKVSKGNMKGENELLSREIWPQISKN
jgi:hypothetical protein